MLFNDDVVRLFVNPPTPACAAAARNPGTSSRPRGTVRCSRHAGRRGGIHLSLMVGTVALLSYRHAQCRFSAPIAPSSCCPRLQDYKPAASLSKRTNRKFFLDTRLTLAIEPLPMEHTAPAAPDDASPDPQQDHPAITLSTNVDLLLHAARILLTYGRHLIETIGRRSTTPSFNAIAANFGTANLSTILAHLKRGILRAAALERVLLARAATGRDIDFVERHTRAPAAEPAAADAQPEPSAPTPTTRRHAPRPSRPAGWDDPELFMPTLEDLERQVRRRPIGRTMLKICLDLAVVPGFCHTQFWNELFELITYFGSNVNQLMQEKARRREAFAN